MVKLKRSSADLIRAVKQKDKKPVKENVTFRLDVDLMKSFKDKCKKNSVTPTGIIEEFLRDFTGTDTE